MIEKEEGGGEGGEVDLERLGKKAGKRTQAKTKRSKARTKKVS